MAEVTTVVLNPKNVLAEGNSRFGLKPDRVERMKDSILAEGRILQPVGVQKLVPAQNGFTHKLVFGFYRHAGLLAAISDGADELKLPAIELEPADALARLRTQLRENMDRENQSPMDQAVAIRQLMDAGVDRTTIREMFARQKGTKLKPASNAWVNIVVSFLDLPKAIQAKIHSGIVGIEAGYKLTKVPADKREAVLKQAEEDHQSEDVWIDKVDEQQLKVEAREKADSEKAEANAKALEEAKAELEKAEALKAAKTDDLLEATKAAKSVKAPTAAEAKAAKEKAEEHRKSVEAELKGVEKAAEKAEAKVRSAQDRIAKAALAEKEKAKKDAEKRKAKPVTGGEIEKAAQKVTGEGTVALNATEIRNFIGALALPDGEFPKVTAFGKVLKMACDGEITPQTCTKALAVLTKESKGESIPKAGKNPAMARLREVIGLKD